MLSDRLPYAVACICNWFSDELFLVVTDKEEVNWRRGRLKQCGRYMSGRRRMESTEDVVCG